MTRADSPTTVRDGRKALAVAVLAGLAAGSGLMIARAGITPPPVSPPQVQAPAPGAGLADLVEAVQPAVVSIVAQGRATPAHAAPQLEIPDDAPFKDFFERFFDRRTFRGEGAPAPRARSAGSGFIVAPEGYIVTNHHVIDGGDDITVVLDDGRRLPATLEGSDPKTDLALLKVEAGEPLPWLEFGDSGRVRPGDWVVAIGNPFGLGGSVTTGIVSARGRDINSGPYDDYLQIDAPINQGNSGGPLFDLSGKVIGVNTAIYSPNGGNVGIGFAIPASQAADIVAALQDDGRVERGWLGVRIQPVTEALAAGLGLSGTGGVLVAAVTPDSPAARAGIEVGDVIVGYAGEAIEQPRDLPRLVARTAPSTRAEVVVLRKGERRTLQARVAPYPSELAQGGGDTTAPAASADRRLGLAVAPLDEPLRRRFGIPAGIDGAVVTEVRPGGPAARTGLEPGDVILQADGRPVAAPADLAEAVHRAADASRQRVVLLVNRKGDQWFLPMQIT